MRIAALNDIHGNLPALEAVLAEVRDAGVDLIVCGGDCAQGPMPGETIDRLRTFDVPARFVMGNADREMVAAYDAGDHSLEGVRWSAGRMSQDQRDFLAAFEPTVHAEATGVGSVLFCHGSPRSDNEIITAVTPPARIEPMLEDVAEDVVVCGHTHDQFDLAAGGKRVLNAGSVGMPYEGDAAAFWLLLGDGIQMRRTAYDVAAALEVFRATGYPDVDEAFRESLIEPEDPRKVAEYFEGLTA
jgi:putative phosphoesterase